MKKYRFDLGASNEQLNFEESKDGNIQFKVLHFDFGLGNWVMKASMKIWLNLIETSQSPHCIQDERDQMGPIKNSKSAPAHLKKKKKTQLFKLKIVLIWFIITWPSKPYEFWLSMRSVRLIWAEPCTCKLKDNFTDTNSILVPCRDHFYYKYNILITSILKIVSMESLNSIVD